MQHAATLVWAALLVSSSVSPVRAQDCQGCVPLTNLGSGLYLGQYQGGLYSGGQNVPPPAHLQAALSEASRVLPRDASGTPDPRGLIGMAAFTMSNANQEFSAYERRADLDSQRNPRLRVMTLAQGGQALDRINDPNAAYWGNVQERVTAAGLTNEQVQIAWLKMADAQPASTFPEHAEATRDHAKEVLAILRDTFPNLRIAYFSSRIYGGYSSNPLRGEPLSYETGFAVKWLIEDQIAGDPTLNYDPDEGPVVAPLLLWGPYLWANGTTPRSDGLVWLESDFEGDKIHPSDDGEQKVADLLEGFFGPTPTTAPWFGAVPGLSLSVVEAIDDAHVDTQLPGTNFGDSTVLQVREIGRDGYLKFDLSAVTGEVRDAKLSLRLGPDNSGQIPPGLEARGVSGTGWDEETITAQNAPPIDGTLHGVLPQLSRGTSTSFGVTADGSSAAGGLAAFGLRSAAGLEGGKRIPSKEGGEPARLVLAVCPTYVEPQTYCTAKTNSCGTLPELGFNGTSSASIPGGFRIVGNRANFAKAGLVLYTNGGRNNVPFDGGTLCVAGPIRRAPIVTSTGGSAGACTSLMRVDFNAFAAGELGGNPAPFLRLPGQTVNVQWWARDTALSGSYLTNGGEFVVGP